MAKDGLAWANLMTARPENYFTRFPTFRTRRLLDSNATLPLLYQVTPCYIVLLPLLAFGPIIYITFS